MDSVLVLLATYQGAKYLNEQLDSLASQTIKTLHIIASDDGSDDGTLEILEAARKSWKKGVFQIVNGPRKGVEENFRSLILQTEIKAAYYAFCDQDDIWDSDKLERAILCISSQDPSKPQAYGARTKTVNESGKPTGLSPLFAKPPTFQNALVQSIAGGNTMLLNNKSYELIRKTVKLTTFSSHDWWVYQIITGSGGVFHYDEKPKLSYRQHDGNLIGSNNSFKDRLGRVKRSFEGQMKLWSEQNIAALEKCSSFLEPASLSALEQFKIAHNDKSALKRLVALRRSGVYRQTIFGQISLYGACLLRLL
ncbi:Alpha-L-Rha alpha-1,3-L-rhamnosyltransferase [hydrothermal vent metagenome]|uniref:Alpha-L-Rha alpha-1,3-L-rhamnosyltransferase n=1 Tax=hydrothermal vent metagenome TaxID=652676 RepID=A0A3B0TSC3_9ZZZZ